MLERFAKYFLDNRKITLVAIKAIAFFGTLSYVLLPKQYNPSIVAPAFEISLPVRGYSSADASRFVVQEIENRLAELEGIDDLTAMPETSAPRSWQASKSGPMRKKPKPASTTNSLPITRSDRMG